VSKAAVSCNSDEFCQGLYNSSETVCLSSTKECSNPFQTGCLKSKRVQRYTHRLRICTSNDDTSGETSLCRQSDFPYPEIRIHHANWASSFFLAWIYQIILVELLDVPATVGLTTEMSQGASFYSIENKIEYSTELYPYEALMMANEKLNNGENCELTTKACAHILPEVWVGQRDEWLKMEDDGVIDHPSANGMVATSNFFVPAFTIKKYPSLAVFYGFQGDENRKLLAELFKKPTTWKEYCELVSSSNCSIADRTAARYPNQTDLEGHYYEKNKFYVEGLYQGYFRATEKNNCTESDGVDDCHGYFVAPPCDWSSFSEGQLYWNNVGLKQAGPIGYNGGYDALEDIWRAANATESHVFVWWYSNSDIQQLHHNTSSAFQKVLLPEPTLECLKRRPTMEERCSGIAEVRRGDPLASCDYEFILLQRLTASALGQNNSDASDADQSPAEEMMQKLKVSEVDINGILNKWLSKNIDQDGNDFREAVCEWVVDNLDVLEASIPYGYPRNLSTRSSYNTWYAFMAQTIAVLTGILCVVFMLFTYKYRKTKALVFAQPVFIFFLLIGFLFLSAGAFFLARTPQDSICTSIKWFVVLGYSLELVPVLLKTAAINQLIQSSKKMQRLNIEFKTLLIRVAITLAFVGVFMICWTAYDAPIRVENREINPTDETVVFLDIECASDSNVFDIVSYGWISLMLLMAALLAFQSRHATSVVNDSGVLAAMTYSHFLFMLLRGVIILFDAYNTFVGSVVATLMSLDYSIDVLFAMTIYLLPKLVQARKAPSNYTRTAGLSSRLNVDIRRSEISAAEGGRRLKILVCSANMGNSEPTLESLEAWIPPGGSCAEVTKLDGGSTLDSGCFHLIAVGMQEATWKRPIDEAAGANLAGDVISEEEILNALQHPCTVSLRRMIQEVLGEDYVNVMEEERGQMRFSIWACESVAGDIDPIKDIKVNGANTGIGNVIANKGGIVATLSYKSTKISFLSAHLAAHEGETFYKNRCQSVRTILKEAKTSDLSSKLDVSIGSHHMFLLGDLNFRTEFEEEIPHEERVERALALVEAKDYEGLNRLDELHKGIKNGDLLHGFETLPCLFPPTFKVERELGFVYKKQRTPSYTDRILYKSSDGLGGHLKPLAYEPCVGFITSDHKPIRGAFSILPNTETAVVSLVDDITLVFRCIKAFDLPSTDRNGFSDPYMMVMWESAELEANRGSLLDRVREWLQGRNWPRTSWKLKTLNPNWMGEEIALTLKKCAVKADAMLYLVLVDYDVLGNDDFMCATALNLSEMIRMNQPDEYQKVVQIDRPVLRYGKVAGRIQCLVDIEMEKTSVRHSRTGFSRLLSTKNI
jgi:hypothetical protein